MSRATKKKGALAQARKIQVAHRRRAADLEAKKIAMGEKKESELLPRKKKKKQL